MIALKSVFICFLISILLLSGYPMAVYADQGSDIVGTKITLPSPLVIEEKSELQDFIRNQGFSSAGPFSISYYLTSESENPVERIFIGSWEVPELKSGAQKTGNTSVVVPRSTAPGAYFLMRYIDEQGILTQEKTANNIQVSKNPVTVIEPNISRTLGIGTLIPKTAIAGQTIPVTIIIESPNSPGNEPIPVFFFLSANIDPDSDMIPVGTMVLPSSSDKDEQEVTEQLQIPESVLPGTYYFFSSFLPANEMTGTGSASTFWFNNDPIEITPANPVNDVPKEDNNPQIHSSEPDVVSLETVIPDEAFIGDSFQVTDTVRNIGGAEANIVRIEYLLSSNSDGSKGKHTGWWNLLSLGSDQTRTEQKTLGVPSDIAPGLYYLSKKVTVTSSVTEKNTGNNQWVSNQPIFIRYNPADPIPDLTHIRTIWPSGQPGDSVQITDTITNIGRACAQGVPVAYYLSPYQQFDPAIAIHIGTWTIDSLCPLEQKTNSTLVEIPSYLTYGEYYFYSVIDPCAFMEDCGGGIPELDKSNNINIGTLIIGPCIFCS